MNKELTTGDKLRMIDNRLYAQGVEMTIRKTYIDQIKLMAEYSRSNCTVGATDDARWLVMVFENDANDRKITFKLARLHTELRVIAFGIINEQRATAEMIRLAFKWLHTEKRRKKKNR